MAEATRFETVKPSPDRVLIVEDEENARLGYEALLRRWGFEVLGVGSAENALAKFSEFAPAVLIADVELPGMNGLDLLDRLGDELKHVPAIVITGKGSEERIVAAIEAGAFWYIEKPLKGSVLHVLLDRALGRVRDQKQVAALTRQLRESGKLGDLVGQSKTMQEVMHLIEQVAPSSASVLITGETGSGKEILARTIHRLSPRADRPFIAINCSAIPESLMESEIFGHERGAFTGAAERRLGCFELADGGTLLLDEIGEMPAPTQAKLLRVLEDHKVRRLGSKVETPVDVRVLAATNKEPEQAVAKGELRQDLYFRLNVFHIQLPPLRDHKEDIPAAGRAYFAGHQHQARPPRARRKSRSARLVCELFLAGKCARAAQRAGTRRHRVRPRSDRPREPAGGLRPRARGGRLGPGFAALSAGNHGGSSRTRTHLANPGIYQ